MVDRLVNLLRTYPKNSIALGPQPGVSTIVPKLIMGLAVNLHNEAGC